MNGIQNSLEDYFHAFQDLGRFQSNTLEQNGIATLKVISYFTLIIPFGAGIAYGLIALCGRISKEFSNATSDRTHQLFIDLPSIPSTTKTPNQEASKPNWVEPKESSYNEKGQLTFKDGTLYEGEFKHGKPDGKGILTFQNGDRYEGLFREGKREGKGILTNSYSGDRYEGEFKEVIKAGELHSTYRFHGQGTLNYANGTKYEGQFKEGLWDGRGSLTYRNGTKYEGQFKEGAYQMPPSS